MEIQQQNLFLIQEVANDNYIFYNSVRHFACRIDALTLNIFNLIYKYESLEIILAHINAKYHDYICDIYHKTIDSHVLDLTSDVELEKYEDLSQKPDKFYLHLTYKCNLGCTYCYNKDIRVHNKNLEKSDWFKILDQILPFAKHIVLTGGEPFLYDDIKNIVDYISGNKPDVFIEVISNCMHDFENNRFFDDIFPKLHGITFSCDNLSTKNQERKHFDPDLFIKNIKYIKYTYPKLFISISSTFIKNSEGVLNEIAMFARDNDCSFASVLVIPNNEKEKILLPSVEDFRKRTAGGPSMKLSQKRMFCGAGFGLCSVDPLGNLYPCQNMHYPDFYLGNLLKDNYELLFESEQIKKKRSTFAVDRISTCKECNIKYICGAGCRAASYRLEKSPLNYPETLCMYYRVEANSRLVNIP